MEKSELVKTSIRLERDLLEEFQDAVEDNYGKLKGGQNEAFKEAILLWLAHKKNKQVLLMNNDRNGRLTVFWDYELRERLHDALSRCRPSISLFRAGIQNCFNYGIITTVLRVLLDRYGLPDEANIKDLEANEVIEKLSGPTDEWEKKLWRTQDDYENEVGICALWRSHKMGTVIRPESISVHRVNFARF